MIQNRTSLRAALVVASLIVLLAPMRAADTVRVDNGTPSTTANSIRAGWEESIILRPGRAVRLVKLLVRYSVAAGVDTIRITGDASEGTIPPTQYCFSYNTLARVVTTPLPAPQWTEIDLTPYNVIVGGYDRIVVQHLLRTGGSVWAQDANGQSGASSFVYDPITPNPNFFNIAGIYYLATSDYMVRLVVEDVLPYRPAPQLTDVARTAGLVNPDGSAIRADMASVVDWNGDGYDDVAVNGMFFRNDSGRAFTRVDLGIGGGPTAWGDVDNDGDMDCFVAAGNRNDRLWRNDGGTFVDVTTTSTIVNDAPTVTALWLDMDRDGDLDLFLANGRREVSGQETYFQDRLWRNDGGFTFTNVTTASGIAAGEPAPYFDTWGASLCDHNDDGLADIFVATYRLAPDRLYRNNGNGTFTEVSQQTGVIGVPTTQPQYYGHGMGSDWADIDNDGDVDLAVGNLGHPDSRAQYSNPSLILRNTGSTSSPTFTNWYATTNFGLTLYHGVKFREMNAGMCFLDLDHDGDEDLWHGQISYEAYGAGADRPSRLYLGSGEAAQPFTDVAWEMGMFIHGAWTAVRLDADRDGDLDLLCLSGTERMKLFRNDVGKRGDHLTVRLRDKSSTAHRHGYGARVTAHVTEGATTRRISRWLPGTVSGGRMAQMTHDLHFGLGVGRLDSVVVRWTNGTTTRFTNVPVNSAIILASDGTVTPLVAARATPMSPANGTIDLAANVDLRWSSPARGACDVRISTRADFATTLWDTSAVAAPSLTYRAPSEGTYFWQVRLTGTTTWSSSWEFSVGQPRPSAPPVVVAPVDGATDVPTETTIRWRTAQYASSYIPPTVYRIVGVRTTDPSDTLFTLGPQSDTTATVTALPKATSIRWSICQGASGSSALTSCTESTFTTYDAPQARGLLFPPDNATEVTTRPRFTWERMRNVDKGYELEIDTMATFATALLRRAADTSLAIAPPLKPGRQYWWRVRGLNLAGAGEFSPASTFRTAGTTSVDEELSSEPSVSFEIYDVLGRRIAQGTMEEKAGILQRLRGAVFIVERDAAGMTTVRTALVL
jgi:hypothetical protein